MMVSVRMDTGGSGATRLPREPIERRETYRDDGAATDVHHTHDSQQDDTQQQQRELRARADESGQNHEAIGGAEHVAVHQLPPALLCACARSIV